MDIEIKPGLLHGRVTAVASKSDAHRAIICAALSDDITEIEISDMSVDIETMLRCIEAIGANVSNNGKLYQITPVREPEEAPVIDCGESGSTLRFLLPVVSLLCKKPYFCGQGRLPERPMQPIMDLLNRKGIEFSAASLPFKAFGTFKSGDFEIEGAVSSQFISGLLFALPLLEGDSCIKLASPLQSSAYADMTVDTLKRFGVIAEKRGSEFFIPGGQRYCTPKHYITEGDWSNAAFWLTAGAIGKDTEVLKLNTSSTQSDKKIIEILKMAGAAVSVERNSVSASGGRILPFKLDVSECPDLFPITCVLACAAEGQSVFYNGSRLRMKESDRITAVRDMILGLGGEAKETDDGIIICGTGRLRGGSVDGVNDHRIVMSAACASLICTENVVIKGAEAINKSYPGFIKDFRKLGGDIYVV